MTNEYEQELSEGPPPDRLLSLGKDALIDSRYMKAQIIFHGLKEYNEFTKIGRLHELLASTLLCCKSINRFKRDYPRLTTTGFYSNKLQKIFGNLIFCMGKSSAMHSEKTLSAEDLFGIECLIDRIPFKDMDIKHRCGLEMVYCNFKEYCLNVFLDTQ